MIYFHVQMAPPTRNNPDGSSSSQDPVLQLLQMMMADREEGRLERQANIAVEEALKSAGRQDTTPVTALRRRLKKQGRLRMQASRTRSRRGMSTMSMWKRYMTNLMQ